MVDRRFIDKHVGLAGYVDLWDVVDYRPTVGQKVWIWSTVSKSLGTSQTTRNILGASEYSK